ncbi:putative quinol monooxygenase [Streptomonospora nanhaiensis]|uniref:putative quinol monooxygenase n=1 Tax=Streptomonospora nanhaiensis TaxID=1323731 RepID=UPI001C388644|nr:antibiotic biosynthesis monooxygenase [Streptomonospora nanhaiensis]MBV2366108.1 antibiotic biosynthesis monooxygenase [Streptomonospora nanhaiensis]MBX9390860.1 antibiotic biosynthesis monooxygenase [Streptomonospora nanhaiensis]
MVEVGLAFICALVAWSATAALIARGIRDPRLFMAAWVASAVALAIALSAGFPGALLDFSAATFRIFQIGVGLLGPLLLAWGAVEYAVVEPRTRFGTRLVVTTLGIVPLVVLTMDRLRGQFGNGYPAMREHYDFLPGIALGLVHTFAFVALAVCAAAALRRMGEQPRRARHQLTVLGLLALAVLIEVLVSRFGLGILGQLLMLGAIAALWTGFLRALNPPRERPGRRAGRGGRRRSRGGGSEDQDGPDDDEEDGVWGRRRKRDDYDDFDEYDDYGDDRGFDGAEGEGGGGGQRRQRLRGIITIYTLAEGRAEMFDDYADEMVEQVARHEPDTLLFACHTVPSAPLQRIVYAIYRDQLAFEEHEQQPHVLEFARRSANTVVATNVIELALSGASATDNLAGMLMPH